MCIWFIYSTSRLSFFIQGKLPTLFWCLFWLAHRRIWRPLAPSLWMPPSLPYTLWASPPSHPPCWRPLTTSWANFRRLQQPPRRPSKAPSGAKKSFGLGTTKIPGALRAPPLGWRPPAPRGLRGLYLRHWIYYY